MVMRAGRLRQKINIEKPDGGIDAYGQEKQGWLQVGRYRAAVEPFNSKSANTERYKNAVRYADATLLIVLRYPKEAIDTTMRIAHLVAGANRYYEIVGVVDPLLRNRELHLYARERL